MPLDQSTLALIARIDAATNAIAARIQKFIDNSANGATKEEINAALQPEVDRLEGLGADPNNPVPA